MHIDVDLLLRQYGYFGLFIVMFLEIAGIPSVAESALIASGIQLHRGTFSVFPLLCSVIGGNVVGATVAYLIGRFFGRPFIDRYGPKFGITARGGSSWRNRFASNPVSHGLRHSASVQQVTADSALFSS
ncbi:DedA family protein [Alicyclobacillus sp. ALC3]|uniref:DedA family protein n=1 Tax=Alicyclobacillus sp. ALC3 TaxID=2796143 RepID=UPI0023795FEB|nr:hypothetical protein [Alicyclobacillus sp. ALC3]WDL96805.1 hypothetical protein JC200_21345 [Alicyclobacillus sp. ALC3]